MLDAYIIDQIRQREEQREGGFIPLRIEVPRPPEARHDEDRDHHQEDDDERGSVIIDFHV